MARGDQKRRKKNRRSVVIGLVVVALLALVVSYRGLQLKQRNEEYLAEQAYWEAQIAEQEQRKEELERYKTYTKTKEFYEWYAREKMGLINDNEILFIGE